MFFDEPGYRIRPDEFALPGIDLTADEAAVIGLATRVWQHAGLAAHTSDALAKLAPPGSRSTAAASTSPGRVVTVQDPHFDVFWHASLDRIRVRFDYQRSGAGEVSTRTLEPWGVVSFSGRWYVVGRDVDRGEERMFRLSRVSQRRAPDRQGQRLRDPAGHRPARAHPHPRPAPRPTRQGTVLVRGGAAWACAAHATDVETGVTGPDDATAWDRLTVTFSASTPSPTRCSSYGADAVRRGAGEVRAIVVRRLRAVAWPEVSA